VLLVFKVHRDHKAVLGSLGLRAHKVQRVSRDQRERSVLRVPKDRLA
jgi:hypothetical protein